MKRAILKAVATALLFCSAPALAALPTTILNGSAEEAEELADGRVLQTGSGFVFPASLGIFNAQAVTIFQPGDMAIAYRGSVPASEGALLTLYVYRAKVSLDEEEAGVTAAIRDRWTIRGQSSALAGLRLPSAARANWLDASIEGQDVVTGYVLLQRGGWFMKARMTFPAGTHAEQARKAALDALGEIPWDWQPAANSSVADQAM